MIVISVLLFLFFINRSSSVSISAFPPRSTIENNSTQCFNSLVNLILATEDIKFAFTINTELNRDIPVIKWDIRKPFEWNRHFKIPLYVINIVDHDLQEILDMLENNECLFARSTFVVISKVVNINIFKILAKYYIASALVTTDGGEIFTYNPYIYENVNTPHLEYTGSNCADVEIMVNKFVHTAKYPKKWRNSTVVTLYFAIAPYIFPCRKCKDFTNMSGIEIEIYKTVSERIGFKVSFTELSGDEWGPKVKGRYKGGLGRLQRGKVHAMIGACNAHREEHLDFDITLSYYHDTCNWLVPRIETTISWTSYIKIFGKYLWLLNLCTLVSVTTWLYIRIGNFNTGLSTVVQIFLENGIHNFHKKFENAKFILVLFVFCSLIISTIFKNQMFVILSSQKLRNTIETFDDLLESDVKIMLTNRMIKVMEITTQPKERQIFGRLYPTPNLTHVDMIRSVASDKNTATVSIRGLVLFLLTKAFTDKEGNPLLSILDKPSYALNIEMFFQRGYPIKEEINKYFAYSMDNGLVAKQRRDKEYDLTKDMYRRKIYVFGAQKLGLRSLKWYFYMLDCGLLLSILTFIVELFVYKLFSKS